MISHGLIQRLAMLVLPALRVTARLAMLERGGGVGCTNDTNYPSPPLKHERKGGVLMTTHATLVDGIPCTPMMPERGDVAVVSPAKAAFHWDTVKRWTPTITLLRQINEAQVLWAPPAKCCTLR